MMNPSKTVPLREEADNLGGNAVVVSIAGRTAVVRQGEGVREAHVAFSCLVAPRSGDRVLCAADERGQTYILAIIDRPGVQDLTLSFPAGASLVAGKGDLGIYSSRSVTIGSEDGLNLLAERTLCKGREAVLDYAEVTARGEEVRADYKSITVLGRMITTIAREAVSRFRNYLRSTEDADRVKAGAMTRTSEGLYSVDSARTSLASKKETRIDGERIFMG